MLTCQVTHIPMQASFVVTFVYAFNTIKERKELWTSINNFSSSIQQPWIILGDFNSVLKDDDRIGRNPTSWAEVIDFSNCVDECGLVELPYQGGRYTWNDMRDGQRIFFQDRLGFH